MLVGNFRHQIIGSLHLVLTNFESFLPRLYKYNLVSTLLHCGFVICCSYRTLHFEILKLKQTFQSNGYPKNFVDHYMKIYLDKVFIKHPNIFIVPKKELVCFFPFLSKKSLEIKKHLQNPIERTFTILSKDSNNINLLVRKAY